ncbi:hypothetical protein Godav_013602, partial [Gossypium davidsonii]|nr:hypothetical protein [Gossypium davidsonii]
ENNVIPLDQEFYTALRDEETQRPSGVQWEIVTIRSKDVPFTLEAIKRKEKMNVQASLKRKVKSKPTQEKDKSNIATNRWNDTMDTRNMAGSGENEESENEEGEEDEEMYFDEEED